MKTKSKPQPRIDDVDNFCCQAHNLGASLSGNTQDSDVAWTARWLYQSSNFGCGDVRTMQWSLDNKDFEQLCLTPDRPWTKQRWETLPATDREAWMKLARLVLYALPNIAERIGQRFMDQAKAIRLANRNIR